MSTTPSLSSSNNNAPRTPSLDFSSPASSSSALTPPASPAASITSSNNAVTSRFSKTASSTKLLSPEEQEAAMIIEGIEQEAAGELPPLPYQLKSKFMLSEIVLGGWAGGPITREERARWGLLGDIAVKRGLRIEG
jgi:hypothetical protein